MFMIRQHGERKSLLGNIKANLTRKKIGSLIIIVFLWTGLFLSGCIIVDEEQEWKLFTAVTSNNLEAVNEVINDSPNLDYGNLSFEDSTPFRNFSDNRTLALALSCSDAEVIQVLLESGLVTAKTEDAYSYLDEAVGNLDVEVVETLLVNGAEVDSGDETSINRYMSFIHPNLKDKEKRAELLLQYGAVIDESTINAMRKNEWRYLYIEKLLESVDTEDFNHTLTKGVAAAIKGNGEDVKKAMRALDSHEQNDMLFFAAAYCDVETLRELKAEGFKLNIVDDWNRSLLHIACLCNEEAVIEYLLSEGLSPNQTDDYGWTPISYAAIGAKANNLNVLLRNGSSFQTGEQYRLPDGESIQVWTWSVACNYGTKASIKALISVGYNPSEFDCYMAYANSNEDVFYSLQNLSIPIVEEWKGEKIIDYTGEEETEWLLNQGIKPTEETYYQAVAWRNRDLLKLLLKDELNTDNMSDAIELAINIGDLECLALFIEAGINVNHKIQTADGVKTLLHIAASNPSINVIEYLLNEGADIDAIDSSGHTPYSIAMENGFKTNSKLLQ